MKEMKHKKAVWIAGGIICICVLLYWIWSVVDINRRIPRAEQITYSNGEWVDWENGVEIRGISSYFMEDDEIRNMPGVSKESLFEDEMRLLWVNIEVRNSSNETKTISMTDFSAESSGWSNIADMQIYYEMTKEGAQLDTEIRPGEMISYGLPYLLLRANFRDSEWKKVEEKPYYLTIELYPEKRRIKL